MYSAQKLTLCILVATGFLGLAATSLYGSAEGRQIIQIQNPSTEQLQLLPKNLSRWHLGARLLLPKDSGGFAPVPRNDQAGYPESSFLQDDETAAVQLDAGTHNFVIDLNTFVSVGRFSSISFSAGGSVILRASDTLQDFNSGSWVQLGREVPFRPEDAVDLRFPLTDTRYLWVQLDIESPGEFGNFNTMGMISISNVTYKPGSATTESQVDAGSPNTSKEPYDFATLYSGARVTHVSNGDPRIANFLLDDDILTYYEFPSGEKEAVFIIDLKEKRNLDYVSFVMESGPGKFDLFFTDELPFDYPSGVPDGMESLTYWTHPGTGEALLLASLSNFTLASSIQFAQSSKYHPIEIPAEFLDALGDPVSAEVVSGQGRLRIPVPNTSSRYMIVRWSSSSSIPMGLRIFEVSTVGMVPSSAPQVEIVTMPSGEVTQFAALATESRTPLETIPPVEQLLPPDNPEIQLPVDPPASF